MTSCVLFWPVGSPPSWFELLLVKSIVGRAFRVQIFLLKVFAASLPVANKGGLQLSVFEQLNQELKQSLKETMTTKYAQKGHEQVTKAVDKLQQEVRVGATTTLL